MACRLFGFLLVFIGLSYGFIDKSVTDNIQERVHEDSVELFGDSEASIFDTKIPKQLPKNDTGKANANTSTTPIVSSAALKPQNASKFDCKHLSNDLLTTDPYFCCSPLFEFPAGIDNQCQPEPSDDPPDIECVVQCMFQRMHVTADNKTILKDELINQTLINQALRKEINNPDTWQPNYSKAIEECLKPERITVNATGPVAVGCNVYFYLVLHCIRTQTFKQCPDEKLRLSVNCVRLHEFVKACDFISNRDVHVP